MRSLSPDRSRSRMRGTVKYGALPILPRTVKNNQPRLIVICHGRCPLGGRIQAHDYGPCASLAPLKPRKAVPEGGFVNDPG